MATKFFDLPLGDKLSVTRPAPDYPYGYIPYIPLAGEALSQSMAGAAADSTATRAAGNADLAAT